MKLVLRSLRYRSYNENYSRRSVGESDSNGTVRIGLATRERGGRRRAVAEGHAVRRGGEGAAASGGGEFRLLRLWKE
jgi:hypothetical protein